MRQHINEIKNQKTSLGQIQFKIIDMYLVIFVSEKNEKCIHYVTLNNMLLIVVIVLLVFSLTITDLQIMQKDLNQQFLYF